jgi:hypothetical protein
MASKSDTNGVELVTLNDGHLTVTNKISNASHTKQIKMKNIIYTSENYLFGMNGKKLLRAKLDDKSIKTINNDL